MTGPETVATYHRMVTIREFENHAAQLRSKGTIVCSLHLCNGQEAIAVGARAALGPVDTVNATYRGHHWAIACGTPIDALFGEFMGRETGINGGRGGAGFFADPEHGFLGESGIVGARRSDRRRRRARVPLRRIRPCRAHRVRRRRAQSGRSARGDDLRRDLPPAGGVPLREQRLCGVHADRVDVARRRARAAGGDVRIPRRRCRRNRPAPGGGCGRRCRRPCPGGGRPHARGRLRAPARRTPHPRSRALPPREARRPHGPPSRTRSPSCGARSSRRAWPGRRRSAGLRRTPAPRCGAPPSSAAEAPASDPARLEQHVYA